MLEEIDGLPLLTLCAAWTAFWRLSHLLLPASDFFAARRRAKRPKSDHFVAFWDVFGMKSRLSGRESMRIRGSEAAAHAPLLRQCLCGGPGALRELLRGGREDAVPLGFGPVSHAKLARF